MYCLPAVQNISSPFYKQAYSYIEPKWLYNNHHHINDTNDGIRHVVAFMTLSQYLLINHI